MPRIFSIGYAQMTPEALRALVSRLRVTLIDVRSRPSGRVKKGFSKKDLTELLGDKYEWHGDTLGGKGDGVKPQGLEMLTKDKRRLMLMCQEHAPGDCHRHSAIAVPLLAHGIDVSHIYEKEVIGAATLKAAIDDHDPDAEYESTDLAHAFAEVGPLAVIA